MIEVITVRGKKYILVGTAHVSKESVEEVGDSILSFKPEGVAVELCESRYQKIMGTDQGYEQLNIEDVIKKGQGMMMVANFFLSSYQKRIGESLGVQPGAEMVKGIEVAQKEGIPLVLADRRVDITLKRVLGKLTFWEKMKGFYQLISFYFSDEEDEGDDEVITSEAIESLKNQEAISNSLEQLGEIFPSVKTYLVDERDEYLAYKISHTNHKTILAVIGAAHLEGVKRHIIDNDITHERIAEISEIPKKKRTLSIIGIFILILFIALIVATFLHNPTIGASNIVTWLILTCTLGGLGALLAGGRPLTILAAVIGSPIGAALPFVASGMISGLVEAKVNKPRVKDFEELSQVIFTFKGWWQNRLLKIFTVFFLTSLGSSIGNILGLKNILEGFFSIF